MHANTHAHTDINLCTAKPPVLSSPAVSRVESKAACGAELWWCREDQVQMGLSLSAGPARLLCFILLCYAVYWLMFSLLLCSFVLFYGFPVLVKSNRSDRGDLQQKRWAGCKPTLNVCLCMCVYCVPWLRATRTSVCVSDLKDNKLSQD